MADTREPFHFDKKRLNVILDAPTETVEKGSHFSRASDIRGFLKERNVGNVILTTVEENLQVHGSRHRGVSFAAYLEKTMPPKYNGYVCIVGSIRWYLAQLYDGLVDREQMVDSEKEAREWLREEGDDNPLLMHGSVEVPDLSKLDNFRKEVLNLSDVPNFAPAWQGFLPRLLPHPTHAMAAGAVIVLAGAVFAWTSYTEAERARAQDEQERVRQIALEQSLVITKRRIEASYDLYAFLEEDDTVYRALGAKERKVEKQRVSISGASPENTDMARLEEVASKLGHDYGIPGGQHWMISYTLKRDSKANKQVDGVDPFAWYWQHRTPLALRGVLVRLGKIANGEQVDEYAFQAFVEGGNVEGIWSLAKALEGKPATRLTIEEKYKNGVSDEISIRFTLWGSKEART